MTRVVFVGEMYNADLSIGGGPIIPAPQPPLGIWGPTDPRPTHPIAGYPWPQPPTGQPPYPSQGLPPFATNLPVFPPSSGGGSPPGIWTGPWLPPYPDQGLPGHQPYPDQGLPGQQPRPDQSLPPFPSHPWVPPQSPVIDPIDPSKAYVAAYMPKADGSGYERITFTVQIPEPTVPTEPAPKV